jgi:hypothetical protein
MGLKEDAWDAMDDSYAAEDSRGSRSALLTHNGGAAFAYICTDLIRLR